MNPTIRDVAKKLNLSITTISRALDGYDDVAEGTRKLVIKTAHEMGYVPNRAAHQLRRQQTDTIGCSFHCPRSRHKSALDSYRIRCQREAGGSNTGRPICCGLVNHQPVIWIRLM
jgi:hypothetical protein